MLENGSIYHSKGGFLSFSSSSKKWRQPTSHKFEGYKSIHSTQTLQDVEVRLPMQNRCFHCVLQKGDYMCKIDLKDAYLSVPLYKEPQKLARFILARNLYEFLCLCFSLGSALHPKHLQIH